MGATCIIILQQKTEAPTCTCRSSMYRYEDWALLLKIRRDITKNTQTTNFSSSMLFNVASWAGALTLPNWPGLRHFARRPCLPAATPPKSKAAVCRHPTFLNFSLLPWQQSCTLAAVRCHFVGSRRVVGSLPAVFLILPELCEEEHLLNCQWVKHRAKRNAFLMNSGGGDIRLSVTWVASLRTCTTVRSRY